MQQGIDSTKELENKSNIFLDYIGLTYLNTLYIKLSTYAKNDFSKFSAIFAAAITVGIWFIRTCGYVYQSGKLSLYNIDKSYISLDDNFFLQIIEVFAVEIFFIIVNYVYFYISTKEDNTKLHIKRKFRKLLFYIIEILSVLFFIAIRNSYSFKSIIKEFQSYSCLTWLSLTSMLLVLAALFNVLGIQAVHSKYRASQINTANPPKKGICMRKYNSHFAIIIAIFVFSSLFAIFVYFFSIFNENQRTNYKIITEQVEELTNNNTDFVFQDNTIYQLYAVVFENEDIYIVCQLQKSENEITIDKNYQRILSKENVITYNFSNIYNIHYIN